MPPFFSSITRIADLEKRPFEVRPLPRASWATRDYVLCEATGKPGPLYHVELPSGRVIVHELKRRGLTVAAAMLTGAARYRGLLSLGDAGADHQFDFVDVGLLSTVCPPDEFKAALQQLLTQMAACDADVLVAEAGASPLEPYNGAVAMEVLEDSLRMLVLCASAPYAVLGVQRPFEREPDIVCGPAANTDSAVDPVHKLCGLRALNLLRQDARSELNQSLDEQLVRCT